jgi:broad specificity phosphatase PhoE
VLAWSVSPAGAQEVVFVVRHGSPPALLSLDELRDDTPLSETGTQRAGILASRLKEAGISAIYATEALRTVQMAEPLARMLGLSIHQIPRRDVEGLVARLRSEHSKDRVLVVGHFNTVPRILKALGHTVEVKIERTAYDEIFVVVPATGTAPVFIHLRY